MIRTRGFMDLQSTALGLSATVAFVWWKERDSNPRTTFTEIDGLANRCLQPLSHPSICILYSDDKLLSTIILVRDNRFELLTSNESNWRSTN